MNEVTLSLSQAERLMNSIYWVLSPYMDEKNGISERPWLVELADCYNELYALLPSAELTYEIIYY
jgi:hypothetical protein